MISIKLFKAASKPSVKTMDYDGILKHLGEFGLYQKRTFFLASLVGLPVAFQVIASVFITANMDHWCAIPDADKFNCSNLDMITEGHVCQQLKMMYMYIPSNEGQDQKCSRFIVDLENTSVISSDATLVEYNVNATTTYTTIVCDQGWQYDTSRYKASIVSEFDLVCGRENLVSYVQSIYFAGMLVGSLTCGTVADWIGRLPTFIMCTGMLTLCGTLSAFVTSYAAFATLRFFNASFAIGMFIMVFVMSTEFIGSSKREIPGVIMNLTFAIGYMILPVLAYFLRDWRHLQLVISLPVMIFFLLLLIMHESARWLITHQKYDRAKKIIQKAAKLNDVTIPAQLLTVNMSKEEESKLKTSNYRYTLLDLYRTPQMRKKTVIIMMNWFVINMVYYGISLSTSGLGVNEYVACFVSGAVEIPAILFSWFGIQKWGRRVPHCTFMIIGGVACLCTIVIPLGVYRTTVAMIGKFGISACFAIIYVYSAEIYPTVVRSIGMGVSSMSARVSGVLSPMILLLQKYWQPLPLVVFGTCAIVAGFLILLLPETVRRPLPETLQDGEMFEKNNQKYSSEDNKHELANGKYKEIPTDDGAPAV